MPAHASSLALEQFGPRLLAFWKQALAGSVRIPVDRKQTAINLRHRLYRLRAVMKREKHELYPLVSRVIIQIVNNTDEKTREEKPWILLATHVDKQFEELLKDISLDEAPEIE